MPLLILVSQSLSCVQLFVTPRTAAHQASLSFTISRSLLKLMSTESVMPSNYLILCPFSSCPQSFPASGSFPMSQPFLLIRWPKYWSFTFSIHPSKEYSGLISFRMDRFDLLAVQETLNSLLQHHSLKTLSLLYGPTLTSMCDYRKNHSFDYTDLCQQSNVSAF